MACDLRDRVAKRYVSYTQYSLQALVGKLILFGIRLHHANTLTEVLSGGSLRQCCPGVPCGIVSLRRLWFRYADWRTAACYFVTQTFPALRPATITNPAVALVRTPVSQRVSRAVHRCGGAAPTRDSVNVVHCAAVSETRPLYVLPPSSERPVSPSQLYPAGWVTH
jgi:hypothetical protein